MKESYKFNNVVFKERMFELFKTKDQYKIAELLNVSASTVSHWFNDTRPNIETLIEISNNYNCSIDWLIGNDDKPIKKEPTAYNICKSIVELGLLVPLSFGYVDGVEFDEEGFTHEIQYVAMYCDYRLPHEYHRLVGNYVNDFLFKYMKLKKALTDDLINSDDFRQIINKHLNTIYEKESIPAGVDEDLPFND